MTHEELARRLYELKKENEELKLTLAALKKLIRERAQSL